MLQTLQRIFVAALLLVALPAVAQDDPPARVGRLAVFENEVFFGPTVAFRPNRPR